MYKQIKASIKPLIQDQELYKKVKAEIKKVVGAEGFQSTAKRLGVSVDFVRNYFDSITDYSASELRNLILEKLTKEDVKEHAKDSLKFWHSSHSDSNPSESEKELKEYCKILGIDFESEFKKLMRKYERQNQKLDKQGE